MLSAIALFAAAPAAAQSAPTGKPLITHAYLIHLGYEVRWQDVLDDDTNSVREASVTGYDIQYRAMGTTSWTDVSHSGTSWTVRITGLTIGTEYQVRVRKTNAAGNGPWSDIEDADAVVSRSGIDPPVGARVTPGNAKATFTWGVPTHTSGRTITGYDIFVRGAAPGSTFSKTVIVSGATTTSGEVTGLTNGTEYEGYVRARSLEGGAHTTPWLTFTPRASTRRVSFAQSTYSVIEGASVTLTVNVSPALTTASSVNVVMTNRRTTAASSDYSVTGLTGISLTLAANATTATFTLAATSDTNTEDPEKVEYVLEAIQNADYVVTGSGDTALVTISDPPSTVATLSSLAASTSASSTGTFTSLNIGTFASGTTSYMATVANSVTHAKLTPALTDTDATVKVGVGTSLTTVTSGSASSAIALSVGSNALKVVVTAEDGTTMQTYTVTVTRQASTVATLSGLTASTSTSATGSFTSLSIGTFATSTTSYTATVANSVTHAKLTPTLTDSDATVKVGVGTSLTAVTSGSASGAIALSVGSNAIKAVVTAEDGMTMQTYTVTVTRQPSTVATLSGLTASTSTSATGSFTSLNIGTFASGTTSYTATVANSVTHAKLTPTVTHSAATVMVGKGSSLTTVASGSASGAIALSVGSNAIKAVVTAEDGTTTQTYTVTVTRQASTVATLSGLTASTSMSATGTFTSLNIGTFAASTTSYTASVDNSVTHLKLTPTVADSDATVKVGKGSSLTTVTSGTASVAIALLVGSNAIKAVVTAEDGTTTQTYTVTVTRHTIPTVSLSAAPIRVVEGASVTVTAMLSRALSSAVTIPVTVSTASPNTAESSDIGTLTSIAIAAGQTTGTGTITTNHDSGKDDETFTVSLGTSLPSSVSAGTPASVTVTIADDETNVAVSFSSAEMTLCEDGPKKYLPELVLSRRPDTSYAAIWLTGDAGTSEHRDHDWHYSAVISLQRRTHFVQQNPYAIRALPDADSDFEEFTVEINESKIPAGFVAANPRKVTVTIIDDDIWGQDGCDIQPARLSVTGDRGFEREGGWIDFTVSVDRNSLEPFTVDYRTENGTATAGEDYSPTSGRLTFQPTQRSQKVRVSLFDDNVPDDGEETFRLVLHNPQGAVIEKAEGTGTIVDYKRAEDPQEEPSTGATLSDLRASTSTGATSWYTSLNIGRFASGTTSYTASVDHSTTHVKLTPTVTDADATVKVGKGSTLMTVASGSASGAIALSVGSNAIKAEVTAKDGTTTQTYTVTVTRQEAISTSVTLSGLTASTATSSGGPFTPLSIGTFASGTTSYTASVDNSTTHVRLTPTASDANATVKVGKGSSLTTVSSGSASAAIALSVGSNAIKAEVTAGDGTTTQTYTVTVTRRQVQQTPSTPAVATLSGLTVSTATSSAGPFTPLSIGAFASGTTSYSASVDNSTTHARLTPTVTDADATLRVGVGTSLTAVASGSASAAIALSVGENAISVEVTAEDGTTTQTYTVTVTRLQAQQTPPPSPSTVATLFDLTASRSTSATGTFTPLSIGTFASGTTSYTASVDHSTTHMKLTPTVTDPDATVRVGKGSSLTAVTSGSASDAIELSVGSNAISVEVTAEDGTTTQTYTVTVTRQQAQHIPSTDASLSDLRATTSASAAGWNTRLNIGTFASATTSYTASVTHSRTHARLIPTTTDPDATVKVGKGSSLETVASGSASDAIALSVGENTFTAEVTAEDGTTTQTYTVTLTRQQEQTTSSTVASLSGASGLTAEDGTTKTHAVHMERAAAVPLTASFENVPEEHDGDAEFALDLRFSEALGNGGLAPTAASFHVGAGKATEVENLGGGLWRVRVKPSSWRDMTVTLADGRDCGSAGAVCTADSRALSNTAVVSVSGPVRIRIEGGRVRDGHGEGIEFAVTLNRASAGPVSVDYATIDGTATAGEDYKASSGTLTFAAGETDLTLRVAVLDHDIGEGGGSFFVRLSNPSGAYLRDMHRKVSGTIRRTDPLPHRWLARFGRTATDHVVDALGTRFNDAEFATGREATLAGTLLTASDAEVSPLAFANDGRYSATADASVCSFDVARCAVSMSPDILDSSFRASWGNAKSGQGFTAWGHAAGTFFSGEDARVAVDSDATTLMIGADAAWSRFLGGLSMARTTGTGSYNGTGGGALTGTLTAVHPYLRVRATERLSAWATLGWGSGELKKETDSDTRWTTPMTMRMTAGGLRGVFLRGSGLELAGRLDARSTRVTSEAAKNDGNLVAAVGDATRLRLLLEGSRPFVLNVHQTLTPTVKVGLRRDGGDAETGAGVETGGSVRYVDSRLGLVVDVSGRQLSAHDDEDYSEWGVDASVRLDPAVDGRGLSLTLAPAWGAESTGSAGRLWSMADQHGMRRHGPDSAMRLIGDVAYGLDAFSGRGGVEPYVGVAMTDFGRDWRTGVRWTLGAATEFGFEATRSESTVRPASNALSLRFAWRPN